MAKTQILEYTIYLPDQKLVDDLNAAIKAGTGPGLLLKGFNWQTLQFEPLGVLRAPYNSSAPEGGAAVEFAIEAGIYPPALPIQSPSAPLTGPCVRSAWFGSGSNFPINVATFTRKSGGWFGISFLFGTTTKFYWVGKFAYVAPTGTVEDPGTGTVVTEPAPIPQRLMLCDFLEDNSVGDLDAGQDSALINSFTSDTESSTRHSSRWPGGMGYAYRPGNVSTNWANQPNTTPATNGMWERFYFRIRKLPTESRVIYEVENFATSGSGYKVFLTPTGQLSVIGWVDASTPQPKFTSSQTYAVNTWHKVDMLIYFFGTAGPPEVRSGFLDVWVDGENLGNASLALGGLAGNIKPSFTRCGDDLGSSEVAGEVDFDSWRTARLPKDKDPSLAEWASGNGYTAGDYVQTTAINKTRPGAVLAYKALTTHSSPSPDPASSPTTWARVGASQDWLHGSRIERVRPTAFSANHVGASWANTLMGASGANLDQYPCGTATSLTPHILTTVAGALAAVDTDVARLKAIPGVIGCVAAVIAKFGTRGDANGTLGGVATIAASSGGGTKSVSTALLVEGNLGSFRWNSTLLNLMDGAADKLAKVVDALELRYTSGGTGNTRVNTFQALVEVIGIFGEEDQPPAANDALPATAHAKGIHNGPYFDSPWYGSLSPPFAPILVSSGTYVSDGNARYLTFPLPPHFLLIRRVDITGAEPCVWWPSMLVGHVGLAQRSDGYNFGKAEKDPTFVPAAGEDQQQERYRIQILGQDARINQSGVTYQYVAVCDPAKRSMIVGAEMHEDSFPYPSADPLEDARFTPTACMTWPEGSSGNNTTRAAFKGPGHASGAATTWAGLALSDYIDFAQGVMNFRLNTNVSNIHQVPYIAWRTNDGTGELKVWQHVRYTGNGTSPRTLALTPVGGGKLPLLALGIGNSNGEMRDPSHTGVNSTTMSNGAQNAGNGIRGGGVDSIIVGSSLNTNAQTYDLFVLLGGTTDSNGDGFSDNGEFYPAEPDTPTFGGGWQEPVEVTGGGGGDVPGIDLDLNDDLADAVCVPFVTRVVNVALNRVGVNKPIGDLATVQSAEATLVREHYDETLHQTLRELPWPFATRYANLVKVSGSALAPVNRDWTFKYRTPADCVFPRRLVMSDRGEASDPKGPPFMESSDTTGGLIFCNEDNAQLEYTARQHCSARFGDATFRSAWAWRLAAELAPALSRMADRAQHCEEMFRVTLGTARAFHKLGVPGLRPAADAADLDVGSLPTKLRVINIALMRIGAQTIADLTIEQSREAVSALLVYEDELRSTLRDYPWSFATRYVDANATPATLVLVTGSLTAPAAPDWYFAYRAPTNMIFARRVLRASIHLGGVGRGHDPEPPQYRVGSDTTGLLIYTNEEKVALEYTIRPQNALSIGDALFRDAFGWRLAAALAPSLAMPDPEAEEQTGAAAKVEGKDPRPSESGKIRLQQLRVERARYCWQMYLRTLAIARSADANEQQQERQDKTDPDWIAGR